MGTIKVGVGNLLNFCTTKITISKVNHKLPTEGQYWSIYYRFRANIPNYKDFKVRAKINLLTKCKETTNRKFTKKSINIPKFLIVYKYGQKFKFTHI